MHLIAASFFSQTSVMSSRNRYMAAAEIRDAEALPSGFSTLKLPRQRYAIFVHRGHISGIANTAHHIFTTWFPQSGYRHGELPDLMERYDERFDPHSGMGAVEIWVPLKG